MEAHLNRDVRNYFDATCSPQRSGRARPITCPSKITRFDLHGFIFWRRIKNMIYESTAQFDESLVTRLSVDVGNVRQMTESLLVNASTALIEHTALISD
ncbi:hypothetical protein AVEN_179439-1 [Araneus ventricosus]|uniref:Uncharacterized protein n=1 Tax=Araneus ventricosus TaxID=182803 RepID=A0A4Y2BFK0_ARAVE|nr:hypothetical protein AVEN_179439-1 [Araneus ventricosus]